MELWGIPIIFDSTLAPGEVHIITREVPMNPYKQHARAETKRLLTESETDRLKRPPEKDDFVASWEQRPLLCRLGIHRPTVWARPLHRAGKTHYIPHCGSCGYEPRGYR